MILFVGNPRLLDCCDVVTMQDVLEYCSKVDILSVDTETTGLNHIDEQYCSDNNIAVSYTHLTLPTTPYV